MFLNRDLNNKLFHQSMKMALLALLPYKTDEGYHVFYLRFMDSNPDLLNCNAAIKTFDMAVWLLRRQEGIAPGQVLILDSKGLSWGHVTKVNLTTCMKVAHYLQKCFPHRIKSVHIINVSRITEKVFVFVKPLIKKEFVGIIYFHPKIDTLYNFLSKRIMPKEYGGESPCFEDLHDLKLICLLYNSYCNIEKAKVFLENLYTAKTHAPEIFLNKDVNDKLFLQTIKMGLMAPLPYKTDEGYLVFYLRLMDTDSDLLNFNSAIKTFDMTCWLYQLQEGIVPGHVMIMDAEGFTFGHATKINFATCMKVAHYLQECYPHRIKSINIINVSPIAEKLFVFVKPLIKKEFVDMIYFHPKIDTLYNFVTKRIMPKEYGGESPCFKDLHETWVQNMKDNVKFFEQENLEYTDEKKRIGRPKTTADIFGTEGTFRKLEID